MRLGTSGFWIHEQDEAIQIGYEDYGVSEFGGGDFEMTYTLDKENTRKFKQALAAQYSGSLEEMVEAAFGRNFSDRAFRAFCSANDITYAQSSWTSGG